MILDVPFTQGKVICACRFYSPFVKLSENNIQSDSGSLLIGIICCSFLRIERIFRELFVRSIYICYNTFSFYKLSYLLKTMKYHKDDYMSLNYNRTKEQKIDISS